MRTAAYLKATGESQASLAERATRAGGRPVKQQTISLLVLREQTDPKISTCHGIVLAAVERPAPDGGTITWEDLLPLGNAKRKRSVARKRRGRA